MSGQPIASLVAFATGEVTRADEPEESDESNEE